jgi:hypothetical protein
MLKSAQFFGQLSILSMKQYDAPCGHPVVVQSLQIMAPVSESSDNGEVVVTP